MSDILHAVNPNPRGARWIHVTYALLVVLALAPGLLTAFGFELPAGTRAAVWQTAFRLELEKIAFGSGWRFWFGVMGATLMALLLLYPLRKLFGVGRRISVGRWFHLHIVLGLLGPILILYHSNFGTGSLRANVALFTMLTVVVSGLAGHYLYAWLSQEFYGERRTADELLGEAKGTLAELGPSPSLKSLIEDLNAFDADALASRSGIAASLRLRKHRARILQHADWLITSQTRGSDWTVAYRSQISARLSAYFTSALRASRRALSEQIGRLWRLLHLPLFAVTVIATGAHIYAVWGLDQPPADAEPPPAAPISDVIAIPAPVRPPPIVVPQPVTAPVAPPAAPTIIAQRQRQLITIPVPGAATGGQSAVQADGIADLLKENPELRVVAPEPKVVSRRAQPQQPAVEPKSEVTIPPAVVVAEQVDSAIAELAKRSAAMDAPTIDPVSKALSITDRLRGFKQLNFDHSKTRFPLTGKHVAVSCENCHVTTIENTPVTCISCHRKDDVHRGRRPVCESCHVTTNWTRIVRKR